MLKLIKIFQAGPEGAMSIAYSHCGHLLAGNKSVPHLLGSFIFPLVASKTTSFNVHLAKQGNNISSLCLAYFHGLFR